ncbi:GNAT family N-acetyltransferase [Mycolicibacterium austroafricanum]|uniref:GNAT family N-acetyltransferase n=1 Tax=Mycolicibacterium austroafricanum TaxID=39687 RepID=UPI001F39DDCC|nr:GNAT family N-acetyltransferase [Mycolicibacterium austroafricanum]
MAKRIEAAEADLIVAATEAARARGAWGLVVPIAGGHACAAEAGSPMNKVVGVGFGGLPEVEVFTDIERRFGGLGVDVQVELCNLADPGIATELTGRGYRLVGFENVLGLALPAAPRRTAVGVEIRRADVDELGAWIDTVVEGFAHPDGVGVPGHEEFPHDIVARAFGDFATAGAIAYLARYDGVVAGGASMRLTAGVAQLTGATTVASFRRRGVQSALLAARLDEAAAAGADIAVVTTAPGSTSQKNVQRSGFQLLYTRAVLVRDADQGVAGMAAGAAEKTHAVSHTAEATTAIAPGM